MIVFLAVTYMYFITKIKSFGLTYIVTDTWSLQNRSENIDHDSISSNHEIYLLWVVIFSMRNLCHIDISTERSLTAETESRERYREFSTAIKSNDVRVMEHWSQFWNLLFQSISSNTVRFRIPSPENDEWRDVREIRQYFFFFRNNMTISNVWM